MLTSSTSGPVRLPHNLAIPPWCPHPPHPRQAVFLALDDFEVLFGGAAGGGKSDALLMAALQYVDVPGYAALLLRKTFSDLALPDAIMTRAKAWLLPHPQIEWSDRDKVFTFPSGAKLAFGFLQSEQDRYRYQGSAYQFIGFDELTQFRQDEYEYLMSRLRRHSTGPLSEIPLRMRGASNPGNIGHEWVKARFLPSSDPITDEVVYPTDEYGRRRIFVPSKLADNPSLNREEYARTLSTLSPILREQLLEGDWGARPPGEQFDRSKVRWAQDGFLREDGSPLEVVRWARGWDLASTKPRRAGHDPDYTVGALLGRTADDEVVVGDIRRIRGDPGEVERLVMATAQHDRARFGSVAIRIEQEPGSAGAYVSERFVKALLGYDVAGIRTTGPKQERARAFSSAWMQGLVYLPSGAPWVGAYLNELEAFPNEGLHDDQVDASSLAFSAIAAHYEAATGSVVALPGAYAAPRRRSFA